MKFLSKILILCAALFAGLSVQARTNFWQVLPLETQAGYQYSHKITLDAVNCTGLTSNTAAGLFPNFGSTNSQIPAETRVQNVALRLSTAFSGGGMTSCQLKVGDTTDTARYLSVAIGTNIAAGTWYLGTNASSAIYNTATNILVTIIPTGAGSGLCTNLSAGYLEIYLQSKQLSRLTGY